MCIPAGYAQVLKMSVLGQVKDTHHMPHYTAGLVLNASASKLERQMCMIRMHVQMVENIEVYEVRWEPRTQQG